jgi:hypothetical protein
MVDLSATNVMLGIIAAVSVLEGLFIIAVGVAAFVVYRRVTALVDAAESRYLAPMAVRVNDILDDAKSVTAKIRAETERVDRAINSAVDRVDDTAERVRTKIRSKTARIIGLLRGARVVLESILHSRAA